MKIRSEYNLICDCIERGVEIGYYRAYKHTDNPGEEMIKHEIKESVSTEISEMFTFDNENKND